MSQDVPHQARRFELTNIEDGETVHQRCLLITGTAPAGSTEEDGFIIIHHQDMHGDGTFPAQTWPTCAGNFKALVFLSMGNNVLTFQYSGQPDQEHKLAVNYIPLLHLPPLHLAVMVGQDSPQFIDCPLSKRAGNSSGHAGLHAAIAKFRMTAYMWQAFTAEDMRSRGLGRRSFRLEEEWMADTVSSAFLDSTFEHDLYNEGFPHLSAMRCTAKIHVVTSERTVSEIREESRTCPPPCAGGDGTSLFGFFKEALENYGGPFVASARPIVAGLILDSHYSIQKGLVLGHSASGRHQPMGISLGIMGSQLTYAWPRFVEEVTACLLDTAIPDDTVSNHCGQSPSMWEACAIGQSTFLHEVGHAFGCPENDAAAAGIMATPGGPAPHHWARNFLTRTAYARHTREAGVPVDLRTPNQATWDLIDQLHLKALPHFRLPGDRPLSPAERDAVPQIEPLLSSAETNEDPDAAAAADDDNDDDDEAEPAIVISSTAGIVQIQFQGNLEPTAYVSRPATRVVYRAGELANRFPQGEPLRVHVLGANGRATSVEDVWTLLASPAVVRVPGTQIKLRRRTVAVPRLARDPTPAMRRLWSWTVLLRAPTTAEDDGGGLPTLTRATGVDLRVGAVMDGAVVHYADGTRMNCGPRWSRRHGGAHRMGGGNSEMLPLPAGEGEGGEIVRVEVARAPRDEELLGVRVHLRNGMSRGHLNERARRDAEVVTVRPGPGERVIGFCGRSMWGVRFDGCVEFGIVTVRAGVEVPEEVWAWEGVRNTDGGLGEEVWNLRGFVEEREREGREREEREQWEREDRERVEREMAG